jgi:hypothetical protein
MADHLQEYLIGLGFDLDQRGFSRFSGMVSSSKDLATQLGQAAVSTALSVGLVIRKVAQEYEELYYRSQRTESSVESLRAFSFAARQVGISSEASASQVEALAERMRLQPGFGGFLSAFGVERDRDPKRTLLNYVETLKSRFGEAQYFVAARFAQIAGMDERTFRAMWQNLDRLKREQSDQERRQREAGINATDTAVRFTEWNREVNRLGDSLGLIQTRIALSFLGPATAAIQTLEALTSGFIKADVATKGWLGTIASIGGSALALFFIKRVLGAGSVLAGAGVAAGSALAGAALLGGAATGLALIPPDTTTEEKNALRKRLNLPADEEAPKSIEQAESDLRDRLSPKDKPASFWRDAAELVKPESIVLGVIGALKWLGIDQDAAKRILGETTGPRPDTAPAGGPGPAAARQSLLSATDRDMLVRTVIGEARGESEQGQAAVAYAVLNRLRSGRFGGSMEAVLTAPRQFEPWNTRRAELMNISPESADYRRISAVVDKVLAGQVADPTRGATHFANEAVVAARGNASALSWIEQMKRNGTATVIGGHIFGQPDSMPGAAKPGPGAAGAVAGAVPAVPAAAPAAIPAIVNTPLAPAAAAPAGDKTVTMNQNTTIHVEGSAGDVATSIGAAQSRVNGDMLRNMKGLLQ